MTRFGMGKADFQELALLIKDVVVKNAQVKPQIEKIRQRFHDLKFCFSENEFGDFLQVFHSLIL